MLIWIKNTQGVDASEGYCFYSCILSGSCDPGTGYDSVASGKDVVHCGNGDHRIFQPELRKALEQIGSQNVLTTLFSTDDTKKNEDFSEKTIAELVRAWF